MLLSLVVKFLFTLHEMGPSQAIHRKKKEVSDFLEESA